MNSVSIQVKGRVQGVAFRHFTSLEARKYGLVGWVKNENDGSVRIVAVGPLKELNLFVAWCHHGPRAARVEELRIEWNKKEEEHHSFEIRR